MLLLLFDRTVVPLSNSAIKRTEIWLQLNTETAATLA